MWLPVKNKNIPKQQSMSIFILDFFFMFYIKFLCLYHQVYMKFSFNLMVLVGEKSGPSTDLYDTVKNRRIYENKVVKVWEKSCDFFLE